MTQTANPANRSLTERVKTNPRYTRWGIYVAFVLVAELIPRFFFEDFLLVQMSIEIVKLVSLFDTGEITNH